MKQEEISRVANELAKVLAEQGCLVEAGWVGYRALAIPLGASNEQLLSARQAFFAGADHLFTSLINVMDAGDEPTEADMHKMSLIHNELEGFRVDFKAILAKGRKGPSMNSPADPEDAGG